MDFTVELDQLWQKTCAVFRADVSEDVFDLWLAQLEPVQLAGDELSLTGPDRARSWIELRYARALTDCASRAAGRPIRIGLYDDDSAAVLAAGPLPSGGGSASGDHACSPLNPRYTFDQFVIGQSNRLAHAAALAVAEQPAQAFNPLFIYGSPGVGKTHLLHAIGNYLRAEAPELTAVYMTAEDFARTFRNVLRDGTIADFKTSLRSTDVLLIDDVQFLQNKTKTEEEFFHTFNALHESGRQLVLTCDRRPRELDALADRLLARFESGLVTEIDEPDQALRRTILRKRIQLDAVPFNCDEALERIAERVPPNVRSLEGALIRVSAFASLRREPITAELVDELLDSIHPPVRRRATVAQIQHAVAEHFELPIDTLLGPSREARISTPRQLAMYLCCEMTRDSLPTIASAFGRNHSTVVHARDKITSACSADADLAAVTDRLRQVIDSPIASARRGHNPSAAFDSSTGQSNA
ncbi:MAG: chromosomal replication initiator protein DnaA [Actinobacteria bacterium]|nr:chromosomal replication initiator protein DnaA [Actinomycetota bacterium]